VQGPAGKQTEVEAAIDTGFNGFLTLPEDTINALALRLQGTRSATLAEGSTVVLDVYRATILWHGQARAVQALAAEGGSLIGMSLLYGNRVTLDIVIDGPVTIEALPTNGSA